MSEEGKEYLPPRLAQHFLQWYCHPDLYWEIAGDMHELYQRRRAKMSAIGLL